MRKRPPALQESKRARRPEKTKMPRRRSPASLPPLTLAFVLAVVVVVALLPTPADARQLSQFFPGWGGPAYADAGRGSFSYSGLVGMPGSPSVVRPPGFFVPGGWGWGWGR